MAVMTQQMAHHTRVSNARMTGEVTDDVERGTSVLQQSRSTTVQDIGCNPQSSITSVYPREVAATEVDMDEENRQLEERFEREVQEKLEQQMAQRDNGNAVVPEAEIVKGFWCSPRAKVLSAMAILLAIVGIVLGVVLPGLLEPPAPTAAPTPAPTSTEQVLTSFLSSVSFDNGAAVETASTPQNEAMIWLAGNVNLESYTNEKKIQRYALATFYYSTNGPDWDIEADWLSDLDECLWYTDDIGAFCSDGSVSRLDFYQSRSGNNLNGSIPVEIAFLSSLGKYQWYWVD